MKNMILAAAAVAASITLDVRASDYADSWGPPVGTEMLVVAAPDQFGMLRDVAGLSGERGLLLFAVRSADW